MEEQQIWLDGKSIVKEQPIPIVRAIWGTKETGLLNHFQEMEEKCFRFPFEHIYVWGRDALEECEKRGYRCTLVSDEPYTSGMDYEHYMHYKKLIASSIAFEELGEHILLDWDVCLSAGHKHSTGQKWRKDWEYNEAGAPIFPKNFWDRIRMNEVSMPLYPWWYTRKFFDEGDNLELVKNLALDPRHSNSGAPLLPMQECSDEIRYVLRHYGWNFKGMHTIPNACWMYTKGNINIGLELLDIMFKKDIRANVEEVCMKLWADKQSGSSCSIEEYITKYHPRVMVGKHGMFGTMMPEEEQLNNHIRKILEPDGFEEVLFHW
jgi:hypothetical protein